MLRFFVIVIVLYTPLVQGRSSAGEGALDLATLSRIREEGLQRSHVLEYGQGLSDGIGARLTGSPAFARATQWVIDQLHAMGVTDAYRERWGEFGLSWTSTGTSLWLTDPAPATFAAQATPWSPATNGQIAAPVVFVPEILDTVSLTRWKGKLKGKIILYGTPPPIQTSPESPTSQADLVWRKSKENYPLQARNRKQENAVFIRQVNFDEIVCKLFATEGALAVLRSRGEASTYVNDTSLTMGWFVYQPAHRQALPSAAVTPDAYGRMARLVLQGIPVRVRLNIEATFGTEPAIGENVLGDIPGTDPKLKKQVVMFGGHLDSWSSGTGATDNGAGVSIALEAMRILKTLNRQPRRTIRIALWGGEEQGLYGSLGYVNKHLATLTYADTSEAKQLPPGFQTPVAIKPRPEFADFDVYFNIDHGDGRLLGIQSEDNLEAARLFAKWADPLRDLGFDIVTLRHSEDTDHVSFDTVGLPGFQFLQAPRQDSRTHHTNLDTFERLSEPDLKQAATILAAFVYNAAQQNAMFPRK